MWRISFVKSLSKSRCHSRDYLIVCIVNLGLLGLLGLLLLPATEHAESQGGYRQHRYQFPHDKFLSTFNSQLTLYSPASGGSNSMA